MVKYKHEKNFFSRVSNPGWIFVGLFGAASLWGRFEFYR